MLPAQRSSLSAYLRGFNLSTIGSSFRAWIRHEIVDDDPWDTETLHPLSSISSEKSVLEETDLEETTPEKTTPEKTTF
jgi:hypothetical protein